MVVTITKVQEIMKDFISERGWEKYQNEKNIAISICVEAGELLEIFQWSDCKSNKKELLAIKRKQDIEKELADVILYCASMGNILNIDLGRAIIEKMEENKKKYPVDKVKNNYTKFTQL